MPRLLALLAVLAHSMVWGQNSQEKAPHGNGFNLDCAQCHNPDSWTIQKLEWDHASTGFALEGRHADASCIECHTQLNFTETQSTCVSCHTDVHENTVGDDCLRCHTTAHWLVSGVQELHEANGFPLDGVHFTTACTECHQRANELAFERLGTDCAQCHTPDFMATSEPNHQQAGFGMDCAMCHDPLATAWSGSAQFHLFFPLDGGHGGLSCTECHTNGTYEGLSSECASCHLDDYNNTSNPNHQQLGFPTDCALCHDNNNSWMPAAFTDHDNDYFPIYSGEHRNEWNTCTECHTTPGNFSLFSCIDCHEHSNANRLADEHDDVNGYSFNSLACYQCHPDGDE